MKIVLHSFACEMLHRFARLVLCSFHLSATETHLVECVFVHHMVVRDNRGHAVTDHTCNMFNTVIKSLMY